MIAKIVARGTPQWQRHPAKQYVNQHTNGKARADDNNVKQQVRSARRRVGHLYRVVRRRAARRRQAHRARQIDRRVEGRRVPAAPARAQPHEHDYVTCCFVHGMHVCCDLRTLSAQSRRGFHVANARKSCSNDSSNDCMYGQTEGSSCIERRTPRRRRARACARTLSCRSNRPLLSTPS
jgi:hypothetical protein